MTDRRTPGELAKGLEVAANDPALAGYPGIKCFLEAARRLKELDGEQIEGVLAMGIEIAGEEKPDTYIVHATPYWEGDACILILKRRARRR